MKLELEAEELKRTVFSLGVAAIVLAVAGCSSDPGRNRGAAVGAATGAAVGGIIGHQSGEEGEGAAIGAATGAVIGGEVGASDNDEDDFDNFDESRERNIDYGDLLTESEKERILERSGESAILDWGDYLTESEKERLLDRSRIGD